MYAFVVADKDQDDEGIMGFRTHGGMMPMVGADMKRVESLKPIADEICKKIGKTYKIFKFKLVEVVSNGQ